MTVLLLVVLFAITLRLACRALDEDAAGRLDQFSPDRALSPPEAQAGESGSGGTGTAPRSSAAA